MRDNLLAGPSVSVIHEWFKWVTTQANIDVDLIGKNLFSVKCPRLFKSILKNFQCI